MRQSSLSRLDNHFSLCGGEWRAACQPSGLFYVPVNPGNRSTGVRSRRSGGAGRSDGGLRQSIIRSVCPTRPTWTYLTHLTRQTHPTNEIHTRPTRPTHPSVTIDLTVAFARWDRLRDLLAIQHRLERLASSGPQGWAPAVDLCETADAFIVTAELPGLAREQIHIQVTDGRLTLQGRRDARSVPCEQLSPRSNAATASSRAPFALPSMVDSERVSADLHDGVLTITVPKSPEKGPRRVDVS